MQLSIQRVPIRRRVPEEDSKCNIYFVHFQDRLGFEHPRDIKLQQRTLVIISDEKC